MSDRLRTTPDAPWRQPGIGMTSTFKCMGCHQPRHAIGSRGAGVFKRCAQCLEKREAKRAA
jgi:hypothetical protein